MSTEEKLDTILTKLEEKKSKDKFDRMQIWATVFTSAAALIISVASVWMTYKSGKQSHEFAILVHGDDLVSKRQDLERKETDEYIQELALLPQISKTLRNSDDDIKRITENILLKLKTNPRLKNHPIADVLATKDREARPVDNKIYKTRNESPSFWVYLGQKENNVWQNRFFEIRDLPAKGNVIKSIATVFKRNNKPVKIEEPDYWQLGNVIGVINKNSTVTVIETAVLPGDNLWALVK
jgi:hypothetical protein